jgi:hypothetical protein
MKYICKYCGRKGTKDELLHHICKRGIEKHYEEDESFLSTLILVDAITSFESSHEHESEPLEGGGGEFSGGGASGDFGSSESESSDSGSDFDSESDSSCDSDGG